MNPAGPDMDPAVSVTPCHTSCHTVAGHVPLESPDLRGAHPFKNGGAMACHCGKPGLALRHMDTGKTEFPRRKKKVDLEALQSPLKRIPGMDVASVRDLIDLGIHDVEELRGRSPEALFDDILSLREQTPPDRLHCLRMAVYYAETPEPDPHLMQPWKWSEPGHPG